MLKNYNVRLLILVAATALILWLSHYLFKMKMDAWTWLAFAFFASLNMFLNFLGEKMLQRSHKMFLNFVYGSSLIRFIFSIFFIVIYLIINEVVNSSFIFSFVFLYLFFTTFEIFHLVAKLRTEK